MGGYVGWRTYHKKQLIKPIDPSVSTGNHVVHNFKKAKEISNHLYFDHPYTFYCHCSFHGTRVDLNSCSYGMNISGERSKRVEWEHIVPVSLFGRSFPSWKRGSPRCRTRSGKSYRGRRCSRKVSKQFRLMEGDLYNIVPSVGEVNRLRGHRRMGSVSSKDLSFTLCGLRFGGRGAVEPGEQIKGFIGRTYLYMESAYPRRVLLSPEEKSRFLAWHKSYPPSKYEKKRVSRIFHIQKNKNGLYD